MGTCSWRDLVNESGPEALVMDLRIDHDQCVKQTSIGELSTSCCGIYIEGQSVEWPTETGGTVYLFFWLLSSDQFCCRIHVGDRLCICVTL